MRLDPGPQPSPEQVAAVTHTRRELTRALDARPGRIPLEEIAHLHTEYAAACRAAGALPPPPLADWPAPQIPAASRGGPRERNATHDRR